METRTRIGGRYTIEAMLGKGGMGAVYRVRDDAQQRTVALKQLVVRAEASEEQRNTAHLRFRREFHTMASLVHPRVVGVFDYGVDRGLPYYTMELLDGHDLADLGRIPAKQACALLRDVASALAFLHAKGLIHRDVAPRNVRCTSAGEAKLIDFGVLATPGVSGDVAGTPPYVAPEAMLGQPLDHRYDLFGLGALAYRILTSRDAYPARTLEALEQLWRTRPALPSALAPDVPPALDDLVMALLSYEPLARPANAAEVIDRLTAIGGLEPLPEVDTSRGWIASAALVGRQREIVRIRSAVSAAHDGEGGAILIEAPSGMGKTRMLREVGLEAQLVGLTVIQADSQAANRGPYGIANELARGLFAVLPEPAARAASSRAAILARVIAPLRDQVRPARPLGDPAEDRILLQNEVAAFFLDVAETHAIALLVDDIQRCDEASAAVLSTLAYQAAHRKLLVAAALRTDEAVRARPAIAAIVDVAERMRLRGLDGEEVTQLCRSLFGDIEHVPRLAHWMHKTAGGMPLHMTELARHLVDRGVLRYERGLWSIPEDPTKEDLPRGLAAAMDARVRGLPAAARALGEALSIHGGDLTLDLVVLLADNKDVGMVFAALDHLAFEEVLLFDGTIWRFRHDGLREALLRGLSDDRRRALHLRVGEALAADPNRSVERHAEIGWHLMRGGDRERGAQLLEQAGRALYEAQSFLDCVAPLEAALDVMSQRKSSARVRLELQTMLVTSGTLTDRRVALRHADACLAGYRHWSGIDVMVKARRFVGRYLAILVGLFWAFVRWVFTPRRGPNPYVAFATYPMIVTYVASIYSLMFDMANVRRMLDAVEPLTVFKRRVPYGVYLVGRNLYDYPRGKLGAVRRHSHQILEILARDRLTPMRDIDRRAMSGAARYMLVIAAISDIDPEWTKEAEQLATVRMRFFDIGAENARALFHRMRGEDEAALEIEARVEQLFIQLGSAWQMAAFSTIGASLAYAFTRDTLGLRRMIDRLSRLVDQGFHYQPYLDLARGEYLREHGELAEAKAAIEAALTTTELELVRVPGLPALAETLLALGDYARARVIAEEGIAVGADFERGGNINGKLRSVRALALVEAVSGDHEGAARRLQAAIAEAAPRGSPLLSGTLHEARARVALMTEDWPVYHHHLAETERHYRASNNPVLIAHALRLVQLASRSVSPSALAGGDVVTASMRKPDRATVASEAVTVQRLSDAASWIAAKLEGCRSSTERAQRLLDLLIDEARAEAGYLFVRAVYGVALAAPAWGDEPPADLARRVEIVLAPQSGDSTAELEPTWKLYPLATAGKTIACIAVLPGKLKLVDPDPELLEEVAKRLVDFEV